MQNHIKKLLLSLRHVIIVPVLILVILFLVSIIVSLYKTGVLLYSLLFVSGTMSNSIGEIISVLDIILLSTVLFIFTGGIYELFIETIKEVRDPHSTMDNSSVIAREIDILKEKIAKMIIIILIVTVFKAILSYHITTVYEILIISVSIVAMGLTMKLISKK